METPMTYNQPSEKWGPYFSTKLKNSADIGIKVGSRTIIHPFYYDQSKGRIRIREDWTYYLSFVNLGMYLAYYGFLLFQLTNVSLDERSTIAYKLIMQDFVAYFTCPLLLMFMLLTAGDEVCAMVNGCADFHSHSGCKLNYYTRKDKLWELKLVERIMDALLLSSINCTVAFTILAILFPEMPIFITSMLPNPNGTDPLSLGIRALSAIGAIYICILYYTCGYTILSGIASVCFSLVPILKHMRHTTLRRDIQMQDLKTLTEIRLLVDSLNRCYTKFGLPFSVTLLIILSVYGVYALIKLSGVMGLVLVVTGINGYTILVYQFRGLAGFHKHSTALLESWRRRGVSDKTLRRTLASQFPLRVRLGNNYIDVGIVLTLTDIIVSNAITLLLL